MKNNVAFKFTLASGVTSTSNYTATTSNISSLFVNQATHNYQLKSSSALRDKGDPKKVGTLDILGNSRLSHGKPDIGAYEYQ